MRRTSRRRLTAAAVTAAAVVVAAACTPVTVAQQSLNDVNQARRSNGLNVLTGDPTSSRFSQTWVDRLAATSPTVCQVTYPPKIGDGAPTGWKTAAMSIGCQPDQGTEQATADTMFNRFMGSTSGHRQLILGDYTLLGTAATKTSAGLWYIAYYYTKT